MQTEERRKEWFGEYMPNRYKERMGLVKERLGTKCRCCGSENRVLYHHLRDKVDNITSMTRHKIEIFENEIKKCIPLCLNCHTVFHQVKHGGFTQLRTLTCL